MIPIGANEEAASSALANGMPRHHRIGARVLYSLLGTIGRYVFTFLSGIVVARSLGPAGFGTYSFLLASFVAMRGLVDLSSSPGFFNFLCSCRRSWTFFAIYGSWLALQFLLCFGLVLLLVPGRWGTLIWRDNSEREILLALAAVFSQQTLWNTVLQVGESLRMTRRVQTAASVIAGAHLVLVGGLALAGWLSIENLFILIAIEFSLSSVAIFLSFGRGAVDPDKQEKIGDIVRDFVGYCLPMVPSSVMVILFGFSDAWLLQTTMGSREQGFLGLSLQYANLGLFFANATVNVLWKEMAEAWETNARVRLERIYRDGTRVMFLVTALIAGFLVFWTEEVIMISAGGGYRDAAPVLSILMLATVYQSIGHVCGVGFLATRITKALSIFGIVIGAALSAGAVLVTLGLNMGAVGIAAKILIIGFLGVAAQEWYLCRVNGWKIDWLFRACVLATAMAIGGISRLTLLLPNIEVHWRLVIGSALYGTLMLPILIVIVRRFQLASLWHEWGEAGW